ncbi:MAG: hypothetical protein R8K20_06515 [Gallionellaceae bacterium]
MIANTEARLRTRQYFSQFYDTLLTLANVSYPASNLAGLVSPKDPKANYDSL